MRKLAPCPKPKIRNPKTNRCCEIKRYLQSGKTCVKKGERGKHIINPLTGRCIKVGGPAYKKLVGKEPPRKTVCKKKAVPCKKKPVCKKKASPCKKKAAPCKKKPVCKKKASPCKKNAPPPKCTKMKKSIRNNVPLYEVKMAKEENYLQETLADNTKVNLNPCCIPKKYRRGAKLNVGLTAVVYDIYENGKCNKVAKMIPLTPDDIITKLRNVTTVTGFYREHEIHKKMSDRKCAPHLYDAHICVDTFEDNNDEVGIMIMEKYDGTLTEEDIENIRKQYHTNENAKNIVEQIAMQIKMLHSIGYRHFDLSNKNILKKLDTNGVISTVVLTDFGMARDELDSKKLDTKILYGNVTKEQFMKYSAKVFRGNLTMDDIADKDSKLKWEQSKVLDYGIIGYLIGAKDWKETVEFMK